MSVMDEELFKALQLIAAKGAVAPTWADWYRRVCRWYSNEFHTPLHVVYTLSEEEVILTYFEDLYFKLSERDDDEGRARWTAILDYLTTTKEDQEKEKEAEEEDDDWYQEELNQLQAQEDKKAESLPQDKSQNEEKSEVDINPNLNEELPDKIFSSGENDISWGDDEPPEDDE